MTLKDKIKAYREKWRRHKVSLRYKGTREIDEAIKELAGKAAKQEDAGRAMHYSQAVLNMAQAKGVLGSHERLKVETE